MDEVVHELLDGVVRGQGALQVPDGDGDADFLGKFVELVADGGLVLLQHQLY